MRPVCHSLGHVFVVLTSAKSNDITNIFVKSILVQKIALTSIYDIIKSPEHVIDRGFFSEAFLFKPRGGRTCSPPSG